MIFSNYNGVKEFETDFPLALIRSKLRNSL